ncbi:MAG: histidine kinase, partial [Bacteroidales bacterium]
QNDERKANKYLSDFSSLMRAVLENSKHDFVPVVSEIGVLKLYLKLEHFRFQDKFDYDMDIDGSIDQSDIEIPPMLIQPYIENAIWHGLRYKEDKGFLKVKISKEGDSINAVVTDNGIGRKKSREMKTKHQKAGNATGLKNTENRLKIINEMYKTRFTVTIEDLDKDKGTGTIVRINIPVSDGGKIR